jgi:putative hydrolase of the HAD superfamily
VPGNGSRLAFTAVTSGSTSSARFDAVLFDVGGIFLIPDPTVLGPLLVVYGGETDHEVHRRAHYAAMAAKAAAGSEERDWSAYNLAYCMELGIPDHELAEAAMILDHTRNAWIWRHVIPESVEALVQLHKLGVPLGVVSNASGQIEQLLRRGAVCQVGDGDGVDVRVIIDSHVVGVAKPDPRVFEFALVHFENIERSRIAYVGDSVTMDVAGARAAGLHPVLLDPFDHHIGADFDRIETLLELLDWF